MHETDVVRVVDRNLRCLKILPFLSKTLEFKVIGIIVDTSSSYWEICTIIATHEQHYSSCLDVPSKCHDSRAKCLGFEVVHFWLKLL